MFQMLHPHICHKTNKVVAMQPSTILRYPVLLYVPYVFSNMSFDKVQVGFEMCQTNKDHGNVSNLFF